LAEKRPRTSRIPDSTQSPLRNGLVFGTLFERLAGRTAGEAADALGHEPGAQLGAAAWEPPPCSRLIATVALLRSRSEDVREDPSEDEARAIDARYEALLYPRNGPVEAAGGLSPTGIGGLGPFPARPRETGSFISPAVHQAPHSPEARFHKGGRGRLRPLSPAAVAYIAGARCRSSSSKLSSLSSSSPWSRLWSL
jgi:hypothetical protein